MPSGVRPISLLLVAEQAMFREGLAAVFAKEAGFSVAAQLDPGPEAVACAQNAKPGLVLLDTDPSTERALEFLTAARRAGYEGYILALTAGVGDRDAVHLIQNGVAGILHKQRPVAELITTIRQVMRGEFFLEPVYVASVFRSLDRSRAPKRPNLTDRDRTVLRFVMQGLTNRAIADKLEVSEGAVKASMRQVCEKLGVRTRTQLVRVALEQHRDQL